jgi:RND superfamily putative drug exporter
VVLLVGVVGIEKSVGSVTSNSFTPPPSDSQRAYSLLKSDFPTQSGDSDQVVLAARQGTLRDPATIGRIHTMLATVATLPHVRSVSDPFAGPAAGAAISTSGTIALVNVVFDARLDHLPQNVAKPVIATAQSIQSPALEVELNGQSIERAQPVAQGPGEILGVAFALVILVIVFGSLLAALMPIVTTLVAIVIGTSLIGLLSHALSIASFVSQLSILIGLGVGVDYALFIISRHRAGVKAGRSYEDSVTNALDTSGRAVLFAGVIVCIALLGLFALGASFLYGVALATTITVLLTMLASLTLLPALLGFVGPGILGTKERARVGVRAGPLRRGLRHLGVRVPPVLDDAAAARLMADRKAANGGAEDLSTGFWYRWANRVGRRSLPLAALALVVVVVVGLPVFSLRLGLSDASNDPGQQTTYKAYQLLAKGFGPGFNGPLQLVAEIHSPADLSAFDHLVATVGHQPGVAAVTPARSSPSGRAAIANVYPTTGPQAAATNALLTRLRSQVIPAGESGSSLLVHVGGNTASSTDFAHSLSSKLPLFVGIVVLLAFILLMLVFRSLVVPLTASVMNLLSVGAAFGVLQAAFTWGWGLSLLGVKQAAPIDVFVPVLLFSILFGLSMDYEVFLVSRMHEEWVKTRDNRLAVNIGQAATGRVITAAAAIMILVFSSFVLGDDRVIKEFGVGLAVAILIDAFVVRTVLVPSLMHLFGRANWWLPARLERVLPRLAVDKGEAAAEEEREPAPTGV